MSDSSSEEESIAPSLDDNWEDSDNEEENDDVDEGVAKELPLFERLQRQEERNIQNATNSTRPRKIKKNIDFNKSSSEKRPKKKHKNAPAELPSNKPVRR